MNYGAVILSAGKGSRMGSDLPKQYLMLGDRPILCHSIETFLESFFSEIVIVCQAGDEEYVHSLLAEYGYADRVTIVPGGKERYHSVHAGVETLTQSDYIFIHDGARPFISQEVLERAKVALNEFDAVVCAVKSKDTVKIADKDGIVIETPNRSQVWNMQTPQCFLAAPIREAYRLLIEKEEEVKAAGVQITDDAMVAEYFLKMPIKLVESSYENFKITTPEDLLLAKQLIVNKK